MSDKEIDLGDYVEVAERIVDVRQAYPDGRFQPASVARPYSVEIIADQAYVIVVAAFYRSPEDTLPGIGMAWEPVPGRTPYTRGSELQNAETSAWGRALVAALLADTKRGIASADEIRLRTAAAAAALPDPDFERAKLKRLCDTIGVDFRAAAAEFAKRHPGQSLRTTDDAAALAALAEHYEHQHANQAAKV